MLGSESSVFHRRLDYDYPTIEYGKGIYLYDKNGKKIIDAASGAAVAGLGHCFPGLAEQIGRLSEKFTYIHGSQFTTDIMEEYANDLCGLSNGLYNKVFFVGSGSEGIESAVKLARQYHCNRGNTQKYKLIARWPSYHGSTNAALSLTGKAAARKYYVPYLRDVQHIHAPLCYHCPYHERPESCNVPCAHELCNVINSIGAEYISAFVLEPVIGASAGVVIPPDKYFETVSKICRDHDIILIGDEVMCGFGRIGEWFASHRFGFSPDIAVVGKGISGGYLPLSAVFCSDNVYGTIKEKSGAFLHGFTFENTPFSCGIGSLVLSVMKEGNCVKNSAEMGKRLKEGLQKELLSHRHVGDIRGAGLFCAVEIVKDKSSRLSFERNLHISEDIVTYGMSIGINLYFATGFLPDGTGDAIMFAPPLIVSASEVDEIVITGTKAIMPIIEKHGGK